MAIKKELESERVKVISWSKTEGVDLMKNIPEIPNVNYIIHNVGGLGSLTDLKQYNEVMKKNYGIMAEIMSRPFGNKLERVIVISSIYGKERGHNPIFDAAKAAQIAYIKSMSGIYDNITWNVICPGHIDTDKPFPYKPDKIGTPEDVANLVLFLCSEKSKYINGAVITVDGGESYSY